MSPKTKRTILVAIQVDGVPAIALEEALWLAAGRLAAVESRSRRRVTKEPPCPNARSQRLDSLGAVHSPCRTVLAPRRAASRARDLRRQIAAARRELGELFASAFPRRGFEWHVGAAGGPRLLSTGELERIRDALAARLHDVRRSSPRGEIEEANRICWNG